MLPLAGLRGHVVAIAVLATAELLSAMGIMLFDINNNSMRSAVTHDDMRSRVSGAYTTVNCGIRPVGALVGGIAGDLVGIPVALELAAIIGVTSVAWLVASPVISVHAITGLQIHT